MARKVNGIPDDEMIGKVFGRLTVAAIDGKDRHGTRFACVCSCGVPRVVHGFRLRCGDTQSCGCLQRERTALANRTHGATVGREMTGEYVAWHLMIERCRNLKYRDYGGRGIRVCERWQSFENFLADMGRKPSVEHSIDRIDNAGNYEPGNCRWATRIQQGANKRNNQLITVDGETACVAEWARRTGIRAGTIHRRLKAGLRGPAAIALDDLRRQRSSKRRAK